MLIGIVEPGGGFDGAAQAGQRVLYFMGDVGGETFDRFHAGPQRVGHLPERGGEVADFVASLGEVGNFRFAAPAGTHPVGGGGKPAHRPGDGAGEPERQQDGYEDDPGEHRQDLEPHAAQAFFYPFLIHRKHQRAEHLLVVLYGNRHQHHQPAVLVDLDLPADLSHHRLLGHGVVIGPGFGKFDIGGIGVAVGKLAYHPVIDIHHRAPEGAALGRRRQNGDLDLAAGGPVIPRIGDDIAIGGEQPRPQARGSGEPAHHGPRLDGQ